MEISTYCIVDNGSKKSLFLRGILSKILKEWKIDVNNPKYVFVLGGDGTFIKTAIKFNKPDTRLVMINAGNFGFLAGFNAENLDTLLSEIFIPSNYQKINLLQAEWENKTVLAVNDIVLYSSFATKMNLHINGEFLEKCWSSGFVFSTPIGSTGVTKGFSGSVISPLVDCYQFLQVAPISHAKFATINNPIILPSTAIVSLENNFSSFEYSVTIDGVKHGDFSESNRFKISCLSSQASYFFDWKLEKYIKKMNGLYVQGA